MNNHHLRDMWGHVSKNRFVGVNSFLLLFFLSFFLLAFGEKKRKKEGPTIKRSRFDSFFIEDTTSSVNLTRDCSLVSCSPDEQAVGRCFFFAFNPRVASVKQLTIFKQTFCVESGRVSNTAEDGADKCLGQSPSFVNITIFKRVRALWKKNFQIF